MIVMVIVIVTKIIMPFYFLPSSTVRSPAEHVESAPNPVRAFCATAATVAVSLSLYLADNEAELAPGLGAFVAGLMNRKKARSGAAYSDGGKKKKHASALTDLLISVNGLVLQACVCTDAHHPDVTFVAWASADSLYIKAHLIKTGAL